MLPPVLNHSSSSARLNQFATLQAPCCCGLMPLPEILRIYHWPDNRTSVMMESNVSEAYDEITGREAVDRGRRPQDERQSRRAILKQRKRDFHQRDMTTLTTKR